METSSWNSWPGTISRPQPSSLFDKVLGQYYYSAMTTRKTQVMLETVHGSHLYGLSRPDSDLDTYRVVSKQHDMVPGRQPRLKTKQTLRGEDDVLEINLTEFLLKCDEGVPQALEAMFSPVAVSAMEDFRRAYRLNTARFAVTYRRTVLNFARLGLEDDRAREFLAPRATEVSKERVKESMQAAKPRRVERHGMLKYRRHALRLMLNLETGLEQGRFNPRLTPEQVDFVLTNAQLEDTKYAVLVKTRVDWF